VLKLTTLSWKYILADSYSVLQLLLFLSPYSENAEIQLFVSQLSPFCTLRSYIPCEYFDITFLFIYFFVCRAVSVMRFLHQNSLKILFILCSWYLTYLLLRN